MNKPKGKEVYSPLAVTELHEMSDGSAAHNVCFAVGNRTVRLACEDEAAADSLKEALNECSWVEIV